MSAIRRIVVAGAGSVGWLAACALQRALKHRAPEICVVGQGVPPGEPRVRWALPSQRGLHSMLGISETEFMRATGATFRLGTEHRHWQGEGSVFLHAHGDIGTDLGGTPFYKYLLHAAQHPQPGGGRLAAEEFSLAAFAALGGKFARPMGDSRSLTASFTYGFHVDERAYADFLSRHALRLGVQQRAADIEATEYDGGGISALRLVGGERLTADLYLDCTGSQALLMTGLGAQARQSWRGWFPCDRSHTGFAPAMADAPALTQTLATDTGWLWRAPLAARTAVGFLSSRETPEEEAVRTLRGAIGEVEELRVELLDPGRRERAWVRNCVALGAAAIEIEPLAGADLQSAALGIGTLIELFPVDAPSEVEAAEYNRVMAEHADGLRDFTLAHYHVGDARPGVPWARARAATLPDRLAHKLQLFHASGRIEMLDHESFEETDWAWLLLGARRAPQSLELQIRQRVQHIRPEQLAPLREQVARLASTMPRHMDFVRHLQSAPSRG
jgi:tryptophan 7-halogenase